MLAICEVFIVGRVLRLGLTADVQALYIALSGLYKVSSCIDELPNLEKISVNGVRC